MKTAQYILETAESEPEKVKESLIKLHQKGYKTTDILEFVTELQKRMIKIPNPGKPCFDICGTGGSGKKRINLSTSLGIKLSKKYCIAKHGNKAATGKVGSFDLISYAGYTTCDTPEKVTKNLTEHNLAFVFAPAFHPALKALAPIRKSIPHPTIFNYLGPLLNPIEGLTAQMTGISNPEIGEILADAALAMKKNILFVHDAEFGLDDVSIGGKTLYWKVSNAPDSKVGLRSVIAGNFTPEDYGITRVKNFTDIQGGDTVEENAVIFESLLNNGAPKAQQDFLNINQIVASEFFNQFL